MPASADNSAHFAPFPATRHSAVADLSSEDAPTRERAWNAIVSSYWKPVYCYVRAKWRADGEEAADLTQGFFARCLESGQLARFDARKARFRTYLRVCLDGFVSNERKAGQRLKRGGDQVILSLDFSQAESDFQRSEPPSAEEGLDAYFEREWLRGLFVQAVQALRQWTVAEGKAAHWTLFETYDLQSDASAVRPTYDELAKRLSLPATQVNNFLAETRREFRRLVLEQLRAATGSDSEYREEARRVLGFDPPAADAGATTA